MEQTTARVDTGSALGCSVESGCTIKEIASMNFRSVLGLAVAAVLAGALTAHAQTGQAPGKGYPAAQAPGKSMPAPQAPSKSYPAAQAPSYPAPQAPGKSYPAPQAPGKSYPAPQAPGKAAPQA
jgi:hypothetical protein